MVECAALPFARTRGEMHQSAADRLWRVLASAGIEFVIVGSVASSVAGEARTTQNVDILAVIQSEHVEALGSALAGHYYFDAESARKALIANRSFNVIALEGLLKFDFFPANDAFARSQQQRKRFLTVAYLSLDPVPVATPEDTILAKLRWYNEGGRVSSHQWRDIEGIVRVQVGRLDWTYLRDWAASLNLEELLLRLEIS